MFLTKRIFCHSVLAARLYESTSKNKTFSNYPKYRNGHILKCLTGRFSSISASVLSFLGRPRPRAAGALDLILLPPALGRTSWLSTSSSYWREHGPQVHP